MKLSEIIRDCDVLSIQGNPDVDEFHTRDEH